VFFERKIGNRQGLTYRKKERSLREGKKRVGRNISHHGRILNQKSTLFLNLTITDATEKGKKDNKTGKKNRGLKKKLPGG